MSVVVVIYRVVAEPIISGSGDMVWVMTRFEFVDEDMARRPEGGKRP